MFLLPSIVGVGVAVAVAVAWLYAGARLNTCNADAAAEADACCCNADAAAEADACSAEADVHHYLLQNSGPSDFDDHMKTELYVACRHCTKQNRENIACYPPCLQSACQPPPCQQLLHQPNPQKYVVLNLDLERQQNS